MISDLQQFITLLRSCGEIRTIDVAVDPYLEAAEIHRRVIAEGGPALLFTNIKGASFPLVTNLFGTRRRVELAFGPRPERLVKDLASIPHTLLPPTPRSLWNKRGLLKDLLTIGLKRRAAGAVTEVRESEALNKLPLLTTWKEDGGPFVTLPLVYTEDPETGISNLGMYRIQRYDHSTTGLHCQIGKGGGFHLGKAKARGEKLPVNISIGGPPALILSAIAPLPENVPELLLASLVMGGKLKLCKNPAGPLPLIADAEFTLVGEVDPNELRPEGPFGDHYGYYSLTHDYPVFRCKALFHRKNAICAATVVGKPRQEDFYLGDYLQELLSPLFPVVMPQVRDLWSYGETGYHSLAAAVVQERYKREALVSGFRILGEGQLALTKFLLLTDKPQNLRNFRSVLTHILERADFRSDLYIFSNSSMDTLDYTGPKINEGSKGLLLGTGDPIRKVPSIFTGNLPAHVSAALAYCPGCLVVQAEPHATNDGLPELVARTESFKDWPLIVLVDDAQKTVANDSSFLWTTFTRFEPASDLYAARQEVHRSHLAFTPPIVIDARFKKWYPAELECDPDTKKLVDANWKKYFRT